jgi:hypothetical protein
MVVDKRIAFTAKVAKNIAKLATQEERDAALLAVKETSRPFVQNAVNAILRRSA